MEVTLKPESQTVTHLWSIIAHRGGGGGGGVLVRCWVEIKGGE